MLRPLFLPSATGPRLLIHHPAATAVRGLVVYVHPFAEEMNKSRRMAALQARALAADGFEVVQIDLLGCGDSAGDLQDASWQAWVADVVRAVAWLRGQHSAAAPLPLWLWGLRAGALVAADAARLHADTLGPCHLMLWQPFTKGQAQLQQFLRLLTAGGVAQEAAPRTTQAELKQQLQAGHNLEVAGYTLPPALALGLEASALLPPVPVAANTLPQRHLIWLEVSPREGAALLPASTPVLQAWQEAGWQVQARAVQGPAFWQTTEIEEAPALLHTTLQALEQALQPKPAAVPPEAQALPA